MSRAGKSLTPEGGKALRAVGWLAGSSAILGVGLSGPALGAQHYVVKPGDFLYRIAAREDVSARQLIAANHLKPPYRLHPGESLVLHYGGARLHWSKAAYVSPHGAHYRVRSGDFLVRIARAHGVSVQRLARINGLAAPYRVYAGQTLTIPVRGVYETMQARPRHAPPVLADAAPPSGASVMPPRAPAQPPPLAYSEPEPGAQVLPLFADDVRLGDVHAYIDTDGIVSVDAPEFGDLVRKVLASQRYARVETVLARKATVQIVSIDNAGVIATYDVARQRIDLDIQPEDRLAQARAPGSSRLITAIGRLVDAGGAPVALKAGRATMEGHPARAPVPLFTTRDGKFAASGLAPGRWRIEMQSQPGVFEIVVPEGGEALVRVGIIRPA